MGLSDIDEDEDEVAVPKNVNPNSKYSKNLNNNAVATNTHETIYSTSSPTALSAEPNNSIDVLKLKEGVDFDDLFGHSSKIESTRDDNNKRQCTQPQLKNSTKNENSESNNVFNNNSSKVYSVNDVKPSYIMGKVNQGRCVSSDEEIDEVIYNARPIITHPQQTFSPIIQQETKEKPSDTNAHDVLDNLFATPTSVESPTTTEVNKDKKTIIYVDGPEAEFCDNGSNLFDLSKPLERRRHDDAESFLKAFEQQNKRFIGDKSKYMKEDSLQKLTRNKDDNKVKARLLALMNYYDVLGVNSNATLEEIKASYKKKALELHPDKVGDNQTSEEAELFKIITKAHEVLVDDQLRAEYDAELQAKSTECLPTQNEWYEHLSTYV